MKVAGHYKLVGDFTLYGQVYDINDNRFSDEQNRIIGFGYTGLTGNGWGGSSLSLVTMISPLMVTITMMKSAVATVV